MPQTKGEFTVNLVPQTDRDIPGLGRMTIDKQFTGGLEGSSQGQMISAATDVKGSAVYSAIERVTGTLDGKKGSFILQHTGIMDRGTPSLTVHIVRDSGSEELKGISGTLNIRVEGGKHYYDIDYKISED